MNIGFSKSTLGFAAALLGTTMLAGAADASHFRGAALVPSIDANGTLTINSTSFWRQQAGTTVCSFPHSCIGGGITVTGPGGVVSTANRTIVSQVQDLSDIRRAEINEVITYDLSGQGGAQGAGTYNISWTGSSWVFGVPNAGGSYGTTSTIVWNGQQATAPILFNIENIQQEVSRSSAYSDNLDAIGGPGINLTYTTPLSAGMSGQLPGYTIDAAGNQTITNAGTNLILDNGLEPGADYAFSGLITADDGPAGGPGSSVEFVWVWDGVDQTSNNRAPVVDDEVVNALVGDKITETITGSDPDGDMLTWLFTNFQGPGQPNVAGATFDPNTQMFMWDSTGFIPGTYIASFQASDGALTDIGTLTINLTTGGPGPNPNPTPRVPEPASIASLAVGLGLMGAWAGWRRRKRTG